VKDIPYYPGCTLTNTARNFDRSARESCRELEINLVELPRWNCCGTVYSLASDNLMNHVAPVIILTRTQEMGGSVLTTLCSMCYNTLKRADITVKEDSEKLEKINSFMDREENYRGSVEVLHLLQIIKNEVGFENVKSRVKKQLEGLNTVSYYGCLLTRPKEIAIDDVEAPTIMDDLLKALGTGVIFDPFKTECCGSYHTVGDKQVVEDRVKRIISSANRRGADAIVTSCPLCHFNLDERQAEISEKDRDFKQIPVLYFTQLMSIALGTGADNCYFDIHHVDPRPLLKEKRLI